MASHPRVAAFLCHADDDIAVTSDTHSDFLASASDVDTVRRGRSGSYPKFARGSGPSGHDNKGAVPDRACVGYNFLMTDPEAQIVSILRNDPPVGIFWSLFVQSSCLIAGSEPGLSEMRFGTICMIARHHR
jgi:hypothetical protein